MANKDAPPAAASPAHEAHGCEDPDPARDLAPRTGEAADRELARLAKALGHPARVRIVRFLARQTDCLHGDLAEHIPLAASTISQHLKILKQAGIVRGRIEGPRTCYCVDSAGLRRARTLLDALEAERVRCAPSDVLVPPQTTP